MARSEPKTPPLTAEEKGWCKKLEKLLLATPDRLICRVNIHNPAQIIAALRNLLITKKDDAEEEGPQLSRPTCPSAKSNWYCCWTRGCPTAKLPRNSTLPSTRSRCICGVCISALASTAAHRHCTLHGSTGCWGFKEENQGAGPLPVIFADPWSTV